MAFDVESLERATLDAVAPEAIEAWPSWLLPFDRTTVGRAISAVPLQHHALNPGDILPIESIYAARGHIAQFRIADVAGLAEVQSHLNALGYRPFQPTLTMTSNTRQWPASTSTWRIHMSSTPTPAWESVYLAPGFNPIDGANRVKALSRGQFTTFAWMDDGQEIIAAATASLSRGWMSIHGLRTIQRARGKGCAQSLICSLGLYAKSKGAEKCFLQVEEGNASAVSLYRRLGFQTAWRYHYWRLITQAATV